MRSWSTFTFAFDFSSAFVFDITLFYTFVHSRFVWKRQLFVHVNQCIYGWCDSWSRKFWEFKWYDLQNTSLFHVSLLTWYREYLNTLLVLLSLKKTRRYRINRYSHLGQGCSHGRYRYSHLGQGYSHRRYRYSHLGQGYSYGIYRFTCNHLGQGYSYGVYRYWARR